MSKAKPPVSIYGGLTLVPTPGYESIANEVAGCIRERSQRRDRRTTPVDVVEPKFGLRASGEPFLKLGKEHIGGHDVVVITSGPGTYEMQGKLFLLLGYLVARRARRICVVTGYFPWSRSDKDEGREELALPSFFVHMAESAAYGLLDRIIACNLHAPQVVMSGRPGFITEINLAGRVLTHAIEAARARNSFNIVIDLPDEGAVKRFGTDIAELNTQFGVTFPVVQGSKRRASSESSTHLGTSGDTSSIRGALVISMDDEVAGGGTMIDNALELVRVHGASEVWGVATHGVLCGKAAERFSADGCPVSKLFISDTIAVEPRAELRGLIESGMLKVASWVSDLSDIVYYHHWDESIRGKR
jgi:ribose-phosphate pyrophosphokinase